MDMSVSQAAKLLDISAARVRQLIMSGSLPARKIGSSWVLREEDVLDRLSKSPDAGRPRRRNRASAFATREENLADCRELYERCKTAFTTTSRLELVKSAQSSEEASFYMAVADFFLQQKQAELVARGVY